MAEHLEISVSATSTKVKNSQQIAISTHHDQAMQVLRAEHGQDTWDPMEEKHVVRKIDHRLLWILSIS